MGMGKAPFFMYLNVLHRTFGKVFTELTQTDS